MIATKTAVFYVLALIALALAGCSADATPTLFPPVASTAIENARQRVQEQAGIEPSDIQITEVEQVDWANACLELPEPDESCAQVITPGWRISVRVESIDEQIEVHTDETGSQIRVMGLPEGALPPVAAFEAQRFLSDELGVPVNQIQLLASEQVVWSDNCLGLGGIAESCLAEDTPGWRVTLEVDGQQYELRTDEQGTEIRLAE